MFLAINKLRVKYAPNFKVKIFYKTFTGLQLCGPEHIAIVRICFFTISCSVLWPGVLLVSGTAPAIINFFHSIKVKSYYDDIKSNSAVLLNLPFPISALILNVVMKVYSDWLHRQMDNSSKVFIIFGGRTETAFKEEDKFSFSLGSVIGFPAILLMTILTSFGRLHIRLLLLVPIQISLFTTVLPCAIIYNNIKIKRQASNLVGEVKETLRTYWSIFKRLRSPQVAPKSRGSNSGIDKQQKLNFQCMNPSCLPRIEPSDKFVNRTQATDC